MFKKVLIALDFSGPAMELFGSIPDLKKIGLEELLLVHAVRVELTAKDGISPIQLKFLDQVKKKKEELEKEGLKVEIEVPIGAPAEEIRKLVVGRAVDLVLIGSVGESSRVRELFLGSTVADVVRTSPVPVLVERYMSAGSKSRRIPIFQQKLATVLLPTDFSTSAENVFQQMLEIASQLEKVIMLHVVDRGDTEEQIKSLKDEALARLEAWKEQFSAQEIETEFQLAIGPPGQQIITTAEQEGATLIAMSRHGRGGLGGRLIIGSTADQVIRRAKCPVLVYRGKEKG